MTNVAHIAETALLLLAAYLVGCIAGYALRRVLHAARGTRQVTTLPEAVTPLAASVSLDRRRPRSPAARLAASVDDAPAPLSVPPTPAVVTPEPMVAKTTKKPAKPVADKGVAKPRIKAAPTDPKPAALVSPRSGGADNLKQIKGIGPKIEASLNALGIFHVDQIAGWTKANIDWVDAQLAFKGRIRRERWVEQATDLSKAKVTA